MTAARYEAAFAANAAAATTSPAPATAVPECTVVAVSPSGTSVSPGRPGPSGQGGSFSNHYWHKDTLTGQKLGGLEVTESIQRKTSGAPVIKGNTHYYAQSPAGSAYEVHLIRVGRWLIKGSTKRVVILRSRPLNFNRKKKAYVMSST